MNLWQHLVQLIVFGEKKLWNYTSTVNFAGPEFYSYIMNIGNIADEWEM